MVTEIFDAQKKRQIAAEILGRLPDWFGLPESTKRYIEEGAGMPFWAWRKEEGEDNVCKGDAQGKFTEGQKDKNIALKDEISGFIVLKETSPHTAENYVMGVLPKQHRSGIGRALYCAFEDFARKKGYSFLQVKTVQSGHYEEYDRTNAFYRAMGFRELECLPTLWDAWNPCQIYVKYIGSEEKG